MRNWTLLLALLISQTGFAQILDPVSWETSAKKTGEDTYELIVKATIDDNWAIYSQFLEGDDGPIPTSFFFDEGDHYETMGKVEESGGRKEAYDPVFEMDLIKFFKTAIFTQEVKVTDPGKPITGYLEFMTCDDTRCLPPSEVDLSFDLSAIGSDSEDSSGDASEPTGKSGTPSAAEEGGTEVAATEKTEEVLFGEEETEAPLSNEPTTGSILDPVDWTFSLEQVDEETWDLIATATIEDGWSIYSQFLESDDGPVATYFEFEEGDHYELTGKVEESGERKEAYDPVFEMDLIKFTHKGIFTQRVKVSDPSQPIVGWLEFMVCDDARCLPPAQVDFSYDVSAGTTGTSETESDGEFNSVLVSGKQYDTEGTPIDYDFDYEWATSDCAGEEEEKEEEKKGGWLWIFLAGFGGGLVALLTPCVFPMIPLTVSYFTKSSTTKAAGVRNAVIYGLSIIVIYVALGLLITGVFGADALNLLSTNAWFNIIFAVLFIIFAISFFGYFEITLPSSWSNRTDSMADRGGLIGIFFMAFTLSLVSFSCTGPIIGTLLVETATGGGTTLLGRIPVGPLVGMLGFSTALALPFALFAAFPGWLNSLPRSGGWMNSVKVTLGFVEIALALKFLSIADLTMGWKILPYEVFLAIWLACALGIALYFAGLIRFPHDSPVKKLTPGRMTMIAIGLAAAVYIALGFRFNPQAETFKTPPLLSGYAPPAGHSYIYPKECPQNIDCFKDFYEALSFAQEVNKPLMIDFTGHGCVNCRKMEDQVWGKKGVYDLINDEYVLVSLYVDERKELQEPYLSPKTNRERRNVGNRWADFQEIHLGTNQQPQYVLVDPATGKILNSPVAYMPDVDQYQNFLECGLERYEQLQASNPGEETLGSR